MECFRLRKQNEWRKLIRFLHNNMTKTELGNYDALKAIKEQLESSQDKTITVVASVGGQADQSTEKEE